MIVQNANVNRKLLPLLACLAIVMLGVGISLPVLPLYIERLALDAGSTGQATFHVGLLTAVFPLVQLVFAPIWGRLSDRVGRRPMIAVGILGFAVTQTLFGLASGLTMLYTARIVGGALSAALLPAASAYIADATTESERASGIARISVAVGLGTVVGPALGALLGRFDLHLRWSYGHLVLDGFTVPFLAAAVLALIALGVAMIVIPATPAASVSPAGAPATASRAPTWILAATVAAYLGITIFETTFTLFARARFGFGPTLIGAAFTVCGAVMIAAQVAGIRAARRFGDVHLVAAGFGLLGVGLFVVVTAPITALVFVGVALLGAGMASVGPALGALATTRRRGHAGAALGMQTAAQSAGQVLGPLLGTLLLDWSAAAPYTVGGAVMVTVGIGLWRGERMRAGPEI